MLTTTLAQAAETPGEPKDWQWLIASRILLLPVIAGLAYELIRFAGKHTGNRLLMALLAPGLWLQRLTTREPSLDQLEVSIRALKDVLRLEFALAIDRYVRHPLELRDPPVPHTRPLQWTKFATRW